MNKSDYDGKIEDLLTDEITYRRLPSNPTEKENCNFNKRMKVLVQNNKELVKQFTTINPTTPYMYGLIKSHKESNTVRPIISTIALYVYKLYK